MRIVSDAPEKKAKQPGPDFHMRLGDEKAEWQAAAVSEGIDQLGTYVKKVMRDHIKKLKRKQGV